MKKIFIVFFSIYSFVSCQAANSDKYSVETKKVADFQRLHVSISKNSEKDVPPPNPQPDDPDWTMSARIRCVSFSGNDKIWMIIGQDAKLRYTEDGGVNWKILNFGSRVSCVDFFDEDHGWLVDYTNFWVTEDGGKNWMSKSLPYKNPHVHKIKMTDSSGGWLLDSFGLYHSDNAGESWKKSPVSEESSGPTDLFFLNKELGWACDNSNGNVYRTTDFGNTWTSKQIGQKSNRHCKVFFINSKEGWYSFGNFFFLGEFYSTKDGGESWNEVDTLPPNFKVNSMFWFNSMEGWLVGTQKGKKLSKYLTNDRGIVFKTLDGGKTFSEVNVDNKAYFFTNIHFSDVSNGYLTSKDNLYVTRDGGNSWKAVYKLPNV